VLRLVYGDIIRDLSQLAMNFCRIANSLGGPEIIFVAIAWPSVDFE
jgi:hypothetical protein